jgi:hypothetical protein
MRVVSRFDISPWSRAARSGSERCGITLNLLPDFRVPAAALDGKLAIGASGWRRCQTDHLLEINPMTAPADTPDRHP